MRQCPKCFRQYDENHKICRACGAALLDVEPAASVEEVPQVTADERPLSADHPAAAAESVRPTTWVCSQCGESVPGKFEVCWNCGANEDGEPDPGFSKEPADEDGWPELPELEQSLGSTTPGAEDAPRCPRCGSLKIIPGATIQDQGEYSSGKLRIVVYGDPGAMIFKDRLYGTLTAYVCGDCGHVELYVDNPDELYDHYRGSSDR